MRAGVLISTRRMGQRPVSLFFTLVWLHFGAFVCDGAAQVIEGDVELNSQAAVDSFNATYVSGSLAIHGPDIVDLTALSTLDSVGGDLRIYGNDVLTNLVGLSNLTLVEGSLSLGIWVQSIPDRVPIGNRSLTSLDGLNNITSIGGTLRIIDNDSLTNLDVLRNITFVGGDLSIEENDLLTDLNGLSNLTSVGNSLFILKNDILTNLDGLNSLSFVTGSIFLGGRIGGPAARGNPSLENLDGLSNITSVGDVLEVGYNAVLTNLDGLNNLDSVGDYLRIIRNDLLTNLDGLSKLTSLGGLSITGNEVLTSLDGLSQVTSVSGDLQINDNSTLGSFCGLFTLMSSDGFSGSYSVFGNLLNPTQQEIIDGGACLPTALEENEQFSEQYQLQQNWPNPFNPVTTIEYYVRARRAVPLHIKLSVYNLLGRKVATLVNKKQAAGNYSIEWDASGFASGVYFYILKADDNYEQTRKLLLLK